MIQFQILDIIKYVKSVLLFPLIWHCNIVINPILLTGKEAWRKEIRLQK